VETKERHDTDHQLIVSALSGSREAARALIVRLSPVIQARAARLTLRRFPGTGPEAVRARVEDAVQDVFLRLFAEDGRVLRAWDATRGASLENYVGLVAERLVLSAHRSGHKTAWREDTGLGGEDDAGAQPASPERLEDRVITAGLAARVVSALEAELSPQGLELFYRLVVWEQTVEQVGDELGLSRDAVYQWRSRLLKRARDVATRLDVQAA
jgi:RNA polymerase sigma-70 factor (ECF subfamily)